MKKIILALFAIAGLAAFAPTAEAGQYTRVYTRHGAIYAPKAYVYGRSYSDQAYYDNARYGYGYRYARSRLVFYGDSYDRGGYYAPRPVYYRHSRYHHAPRVSFFFGF